MTTNKESCSILDNKDFYLSPSRANAFCNYSRKKFINKYVFGDKKKATPAMEKGTLIHNLVYSIIKGNKDKFKVKHEKEFKKTDYQYIEQELELVLPLITKRTEWKKAVIEQEVTLNEHRLTGIIDLLLPSQVIDIKTTSSSISSDKYFRYTGDPYGVGFQEIVYLKFIETLTGIKPAFYILLIQVTDPYDIKICELPDYWIKDLEKYFFDKVQPEYNKFILKLDSICSKYEKNWFKSIKRTDKIYKELYKNSLITLKQTMEIPQWKVQDLELKLGYSGV